MSEKIYMATGIPELDALAETMEEVEYTGRADSEADLSLAVGNLRPDTVVISDNILDEGTAVQLIKNIRKASPETRVVYLCGQIDPDDAERFEELRELSTDYQVYDMVASDKVNRATLEKVIRTRKGPGLFSMVEKPEGPAWERGSSELYRDEVRNLTVFTSLKPGSGKTFVSANVACALAMYGGGDRKIALVEADLENPSVGTVLGIDDDGGRNIAAALDAIGTVFDGGRPISDPELLSSVDDIIRSCMIPYEKIPNLHVLQGAAMDPVRAASCESVPEYYMYLVNAIREDYDEIIVDLNSSLVGTPTYAFLKKARNVFAVISLDVNSIHTTLKYAPMLKEMEISNKIKWILNQEVKNAKAFNGFGISHEKLAFTGDDFEENYFRFDFRIPALEYSVFLNRLYEGTPVILDRNKPYTKDTRDALIKIAGSIMPLQEAPDSEKKKSFFGRR